MYKVSSALLAVSFNLLASSSCWTAGAFPHFHTFDEIQWHPIKVEDEKNQLQAKLPGTMEHQIHEDQIYLVRSLYKGVHYALFFKPHVSFQPPDSIEEMISLFQHIEHQEMIPLTPIQPNVLHLLEIHTSSTEDSPLPSIIRVYATADTLYFAVVEGGDLSYAGDFFDSIYIQR